jgi:hypothetical protein
VLIILSPYNNPINIKFIQLYHSLGEIQNEPPSDGTNIRIASGCPDISVDQGYFNARGFPPLLSKAEFNDY